MRGLFRLFNHLSLDVVLGALASGNLVLFVLDVGMPWTWWVALPASVWVIYTTDHLLDAYRLKDKAHTRRHLFHHRYFKTILAFWAFLLLLTVGVLPFFLSKEIIYFGFGMGGLVLLHLFLVWVAGSATSLFLQKELGVGLIYCLGIWGGPFAHHQIVPEPLHYFLFAQFFFLAMMNLLIFSRYEASTDEMDGHTSFVRAIGEKNSVWMVRTIGLLVLGLGIYVLLVHHQLNILWVEVLYVLMGGLLIWINEAPGLFARKERYRYWGDGAFLFPFLLLIPYG